MIFHLLSEPEKVLLDCQKQPSDREKHAFKLGVCRKQTISFLTAKSKFTAYKVGRTLILSVILIICAFSFSSLQLFRRAFLGKFS